MHAGSYKKGAGKMKIIRKLVMEYKGMHKPGRKELAIDTARIVAISGICAVALKIIDTGFAALLGAVL